MNLAGGAGPRSGRGRPGQDPALRYGARWPRRPGHRGAAASVRRAGVTLGLAGCVLAGAAAAPGAGPAALAAGHQTGWTFVPSPNGSQFGDNALVQVAAGPGTRAWAVGYDGGAGNFRTLTERWNGTKWAVVPSPNPSPLDNVLFGVDALSAASAWAVGYDSVNVSPIAYTGR